MRALRVFALSAAAALVGLLAWRRLSRHLSIPCPTSLAWLLEFQGALADRILHTEETLQRLGLAPGLRVLEVGPGPGRLLIPVAQRILPGGTATGLDIQPGMLERLSARARDAGVSNLTLVHSDATRPHFPPAAFDLIYMVTVLGEIPDREAALRECRAALAPGGRLSITEIMPDPHYESQSTVLRLARAAGFELTCIYGDWWFYTAEFTR